MIVLARGFIWELYSIRAEYWTLLFVGIDLFLVQISRDRIELFTPSVLFHHEGNISDAA